MKKLKEKIFQEFNGSIKDSKKIKFLKNISKSPVYISKATGLVHHQANITSDKSLEVWSNKIFSNKISYKKLKYTSSNLTMKARHFYCYNFMKKFLGKKISSICDFGAGEGNFINEIIKNKLTSKILFTEHSLKNVRKIENILKHNKKKYFLFNGSIEESHNDEDFKNIKVGVLLWTLCNCINPIKVLTSINKVLTKDGYLLIGESSRILVPFKKPIYNYFNKNIATNNSHPWHFSFNSISNLLEISGFRIIKTNRFNDENDLVILAKKRNNNSSPKLKIDNYKKIEKFLKKWKEISFFLKKEDKDVSNYTS